MFETEVDFKRTHYTVAEFQLAAIILFIACSVSRTSLAADIGGYAKKDDKAVNQSNIAKQTSKSAVPRHKTETATQKDRAGLHHTAPTNIAPREAAAQLDRWRVSGLIASVSQEFQQPLPGVHVHIMDPSDYVRIDGPGGRVSIDLSALSRRIGGELAVPLDFIRALNISREATFVLSHREMAAALHAEPNRKTVCIVFARAAPLRLVELASSLSGRNETVALMKQAIKVEELYRFLLYHEVAHCAEDAWHYRSRSFSSYDAYLAECRADAFAVLMHIRRSGDANLPNFMARLRQTGMRQRGDLTHQTTAVIRPTLTFAMNLGLTKLLAGTTVQELLFAARALVRQYALDRTTFQKQSAAINRQKPLAHVGR